jgi:hypothetical protein
VRGSVLQYAVCDNLNVIQFHSIQYRRVAAILLGVCLGAGIFADVAVTQNFQTVDRFLAAPGSIGTSVELNAIGRDRARNILRRNAAEENNFLFENWERAEIVLGIGLLATLFFGERPQKGMLVAALSMWLIVAVQHFFLSPNVAEMGRKMADVPDDAALVKKFWIFHGIYSGSEILKLLVGFGLGVRLSLRRRADPDLFAKEYEAKQRLAGAAPNIQPGSIQPQSSSRG